MNAAHMARISTLFVATARPCILSRVQGMSRRSNVVSTSPKIVASPWRSKKPYECRVSSCVICLLLRNIDVHEGNSAF
jgi:hypothetical protein